MTQDTAQPTENPAQTMRDVMTRLGEAQMLPGTGPATLVSLPEGRRIQDITKDLRDAAAFEKPLRRKGTATLFDLDSLIAWTNRNKGDSTALFANPDMSKPSLTCIADYHQDGPHDPAAPGGEPTARHCHHRGVYNFPLSQEWRAWMAVAGKGLDKDELGEFIEARENDFVDPTPRIISMVEDDGATTWEARLIRTARRIEGRYGQLAQLLAMARKFQVFETTDLQVTSNRDTGESSIQFLNEHRTADGAPLVIPNLIIIAIPVFDNGAPYRLPVRFRYRKTGSAVKFILTPYNPERAFRDALDEALKTAADQTQVPLFMGTPEA